MRSSRVAQVLALRVVGSLGFDLTAGGRTGMQLTALLDPLSRTAQKLVPVLAWLHTELALDLRVYLNPVADLAKPPGSYYRYVLPPPGFTGELLVLELQDGWGGGCRLDHEMHGLLLSRLIRSFTPTC